MKEAFYLQGGSDLMSIIRQNRHNKQSECISKCKFQSLFIFTKTLFGLDDF